MKKLIVLFFLLLCLNPNAIITFENGLKQYAIQKDSTFYFVRGSKLVPVKKTIVKVEKI